METDRTKRFEKLGTIARRVAGKLIAAREFQEKAAASAPHRQRTSGGSDPGMGPGKSALPPGEMADRASAHDREGSGALIGGLKAHTELKLWAISARTGRLDLAPPRAGRPELLPA